MLQQPWNDPEGTWVLVRKDAFDRLWNSAMTKDWQGGEIVELYKAFSQAGVLPARNVFAQFAASMDATPPAAPDASNGEI